MELDTKVTTPRRRTLPPQERPPQTLDPRSIRFGELPLRHGADLARVAAVEHGECTGTEMECFRGADRLRRWMAGGLLDGNEGLDLLFAVAEEFVDRLVALLVVEEAPVAVVVVDEDCFQAVDDVEEGTEDFDEGGGAVDFGVVD